MNLIKNKANITGWLVFLITCTVFFFSAERTTSLWDCGEFILGAYKLQIVHPPGAPLFLMIGRLFTWVAEIFSSDPANIAFSVNFMSGICTSLAAMFMCWVTIMFSRIMLFGRGNEPSGPADFAALAAGLVTGLATAFSTSIWFSAVEGEVYAMSTMFTGMTLWAASKWYYLPDEPKNDKWMIFALYATGLSIGVHLLSLLAFPVIALLIYFKKYKNHNYKGMLLAAGLGVLSTVIFQKIIISGIPSLWAGYEKLLVNGLGLPFHSGLIPTILTLIAVFYFGLRYMKNRGKDLGHKILFTFLMLTIAFSIEGVVIIRAIANPPINMNAPTDVMRLAPYLNREQYGERPLVKGPHFDAKPVDTRSEDRWGRVGDEYEVVDRKFDYVYSKKDEIFLPRISHNDQGRVQLHRMWMKYLTGKDQGVPTMAYNLKFMWYYQFGWMYWRYFMWNFAGRQNAEQGFFPWNKKDGNWLSGLSFIDETRLYNMDHLPRVIKEEKSTNKYYLLPLLFGLLGVIAQFKSNRKEFWALFSMWLLAGLGLCFFNNSPPNEPRERDYVLIGSFMIFCVWIGMGVLFIYKILTEKAKMGGLAPALIAGAMVVIAPILMGFQNFDDIGRRGITAARDYASNILQSCKPNSIIFTYGDNDTYPVWYAQEVEGIRRDVRVINLSLIAVDWYIDAQRRKINESPAVKMSIPSNKYRGFLRNQMFYLNPAGENAPDQEMSLTNFINFLSEDHPISAGGGRTLETYMPTKRIFLDINQDQAMKLGMITPMDSNVVNRIPINFTSQYITKDELAVLDIINSNINDRPIYFSVTCHGEKLMGLDDYTNLEGMALRIVPVKSVSDKNMYIYGAGKLDVNQTYDVIMNKYRWGNFDKEQLFVDHSYAPSVQAMRMIMMRLMSQLMAQGDMERASKIALKYFEAFPNMNFQYDGRIMPFIQVLVDAGKSEDAKKHLKILAQETKDMLEFYQSLSTEDLEASFGQDKAYAQQTAREVIERSKRFNDENYSKEMNDLLAKYNPQQVPK
ncbi:MAG: DUF2723 domain-containing protein [Bacteroidota bacterium]|nr:DUF2723 domain-containing protein [Bacteroidota bacterium]